MKKLIIITILLAGVILSHGQKATPAVFKDSAQISTQQLTDSTGLLGVRDLVELNGYLKDKLLVKDYEVIMGWLNRRAELRVGEWKKKRTNK